MTNPNDPDMVRELRARAAAGVPMMSLDAAAVRAAGRRRLRVRRWVAGGGVVAAALVLVMVATTADLFRPSEGITPGGTASSVPTASAATCMTAPTVQYTAPGGDAMSLPVGATVKVTAAVGQPVTVRFVGDCAEGGVLMIDGAGQGGGYTDVWNGQITGSWTPTEPGTRTLVPSWSCSGPIPCPFAMLGYIQVITPDPGTNPTPSPAVASTGPLPARCSTANLALGYGQPVSPATGERAIMYTLTNNASTPCLLFGYPTVALYDGTGRVLAFHYDHTPSQYVTSNPPANVVLAPGGIGYFLVAKYRCDAGTLGDAATIRIDLPGQSQPLNGPAAPADGGGLPSLSYCQGGANDPGQDIAVSPFEATETGALAH